jgi:broad specificity phosphatase PhoE
MRSYISRVMAGTEILLLRHGQSEGNESGRFGGHGPTPLTEKGRAQAQAAARAIAREGGLDAIWSSDLPRAIETAEPVAALTGVPIQTSPALRERSVGVFTGLTFAEAEARYPDAFAAMMGRTSGACPPGGETHAECTARAVTMIEEVLARTASGRVLFVSHAATIYLVLLHLLGLDHATHGKRVWIRTDNCALHRLKRSGDGLWTVIALNDRAHLEQLTRAPIDEV